MDKISIRGARAHNLKNIDLDIPRDCLVVITGLSGSGKSSLAFDTLYADGQRRYVESLSTYARQFLSVMEKPDVDSIEGLSPAISIEQKSTSHNPRSTVGTVTEIYDYLRLLFARVGEPRCPIHNTVLAAQTVGQMVDSVLQRPAGERLLLLAPIVQNRKGEHLHELERLRADGFVRVRIDGIVAELDNLPRINKRTHHTIEVVVDRFKNNADIRLRLSESFETALELADGLALVAPMEGDAEEMVFSARFACPSCGYNLAELAPRLFSFNNPMGACESCDGLGNVEHFDPKLVVAHPELSLSAGAVRGWDSRNLHYFQLLNTLASHYDFDVDRPFQKLPEAIRQIILYGSGDTAIKFHYQYGKRKPVVRTHPFEGVLPTMERRYRETDSMSVREGLAQYLSYQQCPTCHGERLNQAARHVFIAGHNLPQVTALSVAEACDFFAGLTLPGHRGEIAAKILKEVNTRLRFLVDVGLNYLNLSRSADTLSGGEAQRIRLASQIGAGLVGVMYVLDEPSIGLHQRDNQRLLATLRHLRDLGNTIIVVEHDAEAICAADYVIDMGLGSGVHGGEVIFQGDPKAMIADSRSLTGQYLSGRRAIPVPAQRVKGSTKCCLKLTGAMGNNLKNIDMVLPLGLLTCVTGVSGSGKSTLINDTLYRIIARELNGANTTPAPYKSISGLPQLDKVIAINQSPIGRTPRSNPATYTGLFTPLRELFAAIPEARSRGYKPGRFSFNVKGGRCEACQGDGLIKVSMHFLPDIYVVCDTCHGKRYNRETLDILYRGKNIHEILDMTVEAARQLFDPIPKIASKLQTLMDVGLAYIKLGQSATTLSGGEAQRVKLSKELSKRGTGRTMYILDEPTTGLHFHDIHLLLQVLHDLRDRGNTILIIEHNLDVIKTADWIIDMGPEGGAGGGEIIAIGSPEEVAENTASYTGQYLRKLLQPDLADSLRDAI